MPGTGCVTTVRTFGLDLVLSEPVEPADVVFASAGIGDNSSAKTAFGIFDLAIDADKREYEAGEEIDITATFAYNGHAPSLEVWGVSQLVSGFAIKQLDGPLAMGPVWDAPCVPHQVAAGETTAFPFVKGASWSPDDPNAEFYADWVHDPDLRLPAGTWLVTAYSEFAVGGDCSGPLVSLKASLVIFVR